MRVFRSKSTAVKSRVGLVPNLCWQGVAAQEFLVFQFVGTSIEDEPIGPRIADAVAEDNIETKA